MWEDAEKGIFRDNKRIRSALKIDEVRSVKSKNLNSNENKALEFLTVNIEHDNKENININLLFSDNPIFQNIKSLMIHT